MEYLLNGFPDLIEELNNTFNKVKWDEFGDYTCASYKGNIGDLIDIIKKYEEQINKYLIAIEVVIGDISIIDDDIVEKYNLKILKNEQVPTITFRFSKDMLVKLVR